MPRERLRSLLTIESTETMVLIDCDKESRVNFYANDVIGRDGHFVKRCYAFHLNRSNGIPNGCVDFVLNDFKHAIRCILNGRETSVKKLGFKIVKCE